MIQSEVFIISGLLMGAQVIDGRKLSDQLIKEVGNGVTLLSEGFGVIPGLAVVLVGERNDSATYVRMKQRAAVAAGIRSETIKLDQGVKQQELVGVLKELNDRDDVHGILVQLPLPSHIDEQLVLKSIKLEKDVDGFHAENVGNLVLKGGEPPLAVS